MIIDENVLVDYALGTLAPEQVAEVERFLAADPAAAARVRRLQDLMAEYVLQLPAEALSEGEEDALVERLRAGSDPPLVRSQSRQRTGRRSQPWVALGLAAALGVAAWLAFGPLTASDRLDRITARYIEQPGSVAHSLVDSSGEELGTLVRLDDGRLFVAFERLPPDGAYQLWEIRDGSPRSLAVGRSRSFLTESVERGGIFGVTVEPLGGSPQPTTEPLVTTPL
ncbi:MAG: anti-sigma factor [Trueperaceae bacterium]